MAHSEGKIVQDRSAWVSADRIAADGSGPVSSGSSHGLHDIRHRPPPLDAVKILESMTEGVSLSDENGTIVYTNPAEDVMFGYAPGELVGQPVTVQNAYGPEENERLVAAVISELKQKGVWDGEWRNRRKDGTEFTTSSRITAIDIDGRPHWLCVQRDVTASRLTEMRAEAAVRESAERLNAVLSTARVGLWEWDVPNGRLTVSASFKGNFGLESDAEFTPETFFRMVHPEDHVRLHRAEELALAGDPYEVEYRCIWPDGTVHWIYSRASVIREGCGDVVGLSGVSMEITERKRAEEALREAEQRWRAMVERAPVGIAEVDLAGRYRAVNERFCAIRRMSAEEVIASDFIDVTHPDDRAEDLVGWQKLKDGEISFYSVEKRFKGGDGEWYWALVSSSLVRNEDGRPLYAIRVAEDITDRKLAAERLRERDERYRAAVGAAQVGTWRIDLATRESTWDASLNRLVGRPAVETRQPMELSYDVIHPDDHERVRETWERFLSAGDGAVYDMDVRFMRPDGEVRWARDRGRLTARADGTPLYATGAVADITARKRAEEDLRLANETLEARVAERSRELAETHHRLLQAQKMEAVGQLTGGIAHDFNNLLTAILGNLELAQRSSADLRTVRLLEGARRAAERGAQLTQQLLAFSRKQHLQLGPTDLNAIITGLSDMLQRTLGTSVQVRNQLGEHLWPALADANQVEMAILNLALNARDAMPVGGTLDICTKNISASTSPALPVDLPRGDYVMVSVADNGTGMPPDVLARATEPFFTTKEVGKGSGLGLSQVHGLCQQSGGTLVIESELGRGTTVRFFLPRAIGGEMACSRQAEGLELDAAGPERAARILLVDDDDEVRQVVGLSLRGGGHVVIEVPDARTAIELLDRGERFDLAVIDYAMPGMNGCQLIDAARERSPDFNALLLTGYAEHDALDQAIGIPILRKPFKLDELVSTVRTLLRRSTRPDGG